MAIVLLDRAESWTVFMQYSEMTVGFGVRIEQVFLNGVQVDPDVLSEIQAKKKRLTLSREPLFEGVLKQISSFPVFPRLPSSL